MRPGQQQPQYGAGSFGVGGGQQPQPQLAPQQTGFGQPPPLQQQYTGMPGLQPQVPGQLQQQFTGFGQMPQQSMQTGAPPMPAIPQQYQQQFLQQQQQQQSQQSQQPQQTASFASAPAQPPSMPSIAPPPPVKPQPTGFAEMAASFQTGGTAKPQGRRVEKTNKIPNIRLSFITAHDQARFETLFKSAVGEGQTTMSGEKARDLLLRSRLDGDSLSHIW